MSQPDFYIRLAEVTAVERGRAISGVYSVGPFGNRVSLGYQQKRALSLIWALSKKNIVDLGKTVAVVGAGVSGVMTALALAARGSVVHLYDSGAKIMLLQGKATHRYLHPNVNFWPAQTLDPTTGFPFMNWHADDAQSVVTNLRKDVDELIKERSINFFEKTKITKFTCQSGIIKLEKESGETVGVDYSLLFLCTGFGAERTEPDHPTKGYWEPDDIEQEEGTIASKVVSGPGDGGIIEVLRQVHSDFEGGRLCSVVASGLGDALQEKLRECYKAINPEAVDEGTRAQNSSALEMKCSEIVNNLPTNITKILDDSINKRKNKTGDNCITLIGSPASFYRGVVAPIHLVLMAHASKNGVVKYVAAQLNGKKLRLQNGTETDAPQNCMVRHGPELTSDLLTPAEREKLADKQIPFGDIVDPIIEDNFWKPFPDKPPFNSHTRKLVQRYFTKFSPPNVAVILGYSSQDVWPLQLVGGKLDSVPDRMFGYKVVVKEIEPQAAL